jgi:aspartate aminotransferase
MKLAKRIGKVQPSPTIAIDTKAKAMKAEGIDVIGFGAGEPDFDTPEHIKAAAIAALKEGKTKYTPVGGVNELKDAIIAKLKRDNGLSYTREEILTSCGGKHSLYNIAQVLLEAGDEVIIPAPYWVSYPDQVLLNDAKPVIVPTEEKNGFKITPIELKQAITPNTKIFVLNSPSNPTGAAYSRQDLEALVEVLLNHDILVISDEIYEKIVYDGFKFTSIAQLGEEIKKRTIIVNGASKVFSMTGWRMGFAAGPKEIISAMTKLQGQVTTNINSMTQWAVAAAYNGPQDFLKDWVAEFQKRRDYILERLARLPGVHCFKPQGAFYVFPNFSSYLGKNGGGKVLKTDMDLCDFLLDRARVACVAGSGFGAPGFVRFSYATSMENIREGLDRIEKILREIN